MTQDQYGPSEFQRDTGVSRETLDRLVAYADLLVRWNTKINLIGKSTKESSRVEGLVSKKSGILDANGDTLRQRYAAKRSWRR